MTPDSQSTLFLEGPAGAGNTTQAIERIRSLIDNGVSPDHILLLTPHHSYTLAYEEAFDQRSVALSVPPRPVEQGQEPTHLPTQAAKPEGRATGMREMWAWCVREPQRACPGVVQIGN